MKRTILIIFLTFFSVKSLCQTIEQINKNLKLPDSLNQKEIRIYRGFGITNATEIFRMYQDSKKKWNVDSYIYFHFFKGNQADRFEKTETTIKKDPNLIWLNFIDSDIAYLPNWDDIQYKLKDKGEIQLHDGEYELTHRQTVVMDGITYKVFFRDGKKSNFIEYNNPESYLEKYPNVDELISFSKIINSIISSIGIWNK